MDACRSCGANIVWAITTKNKRMPLDSPTVGVAPEPENAIGLFAIVMGFGSEQRVAVPLSKFDAEARERILAWRSHFATCPFAAHHRGGK